MRKLFFIISLLTSICVTSAKQSPHGKDFKLNCETCHTTTDWTKIKMGFDHSKTHFPLTGQHKSLTCMQCHKSLEFKKASTDCAQCHNDVHQNTVGRDCGRCHNTNSWLIQNVRNIHQEAGFPLRGSHETADCRRCHNSASTLRFDNVRTDCYACHRSDYLSTVGKKFDHQALNFGTNCERCHSMAGMTWNSIGRGFDHSFFPLTGGHNITCTECHLNGDFSKKLSQECTSCHADKLPVAKASYPAHSSVFTQYECGTCHSTASWTSVKFKQHDSFWGIYSGDHKGAWKRCTDCHVNNTGYDARNTCSRCHSRKKF